MVWRPADRAQRIPRRARPNSILRPEGALLTPSKRGASGPTISFLEKEMVPPGGTREKSSGPSSWSSYLKLKCAPTPHSARRTRLHPARWGSRGTIQPSSVARVLDPPGAFLLDRSSGPFSFCGKKRMGGWEAPLLEGVKNAAFGRKKKLDRARGAESIAPSGAENTECGGRRA